MRPIGVTAPIVCWHCAQPIDFSTGDQTARYLYRGEQPLTVVVEDWMHCACGAYQNVRRLNEITVETFGKS
jgi:sarcosine oxidase delta subunit